MSGAPTAIDVTPEELNQAVMREAMRYPGQERQVLEFYGKNAELKEQLRAPIFEEKTVDFILELAKVDREVGYARRNCSRRPARRKRPTKRSRAEAATN